MVWRFKIKDPMSFEGSKCIKHFPLTWSNIVWFSKFFFSAESLIKILKIDGCNCTRCTRPYAAPVSEFKISKFLKKQISRRFRTESLAILTIKITVSWVKDLMQAVLGWYEMQSWESTRPNVYPKRFVF